MDDIISRLKGSLRDVAYKEINLALKSGAIIGSFILTCCLIDRLAGLCYCEGRMVSGCEYKKFVNTYLHGYNDEDLYHSLRCELVLCNI